MFVRKNIHVPVGSNQEKKALPVNKKDLKDKKEKLQFALFCVFYLPSQKTRLYSQTLKQYYCDGENIVHVIGMPQGQGIDASWEASRGVSKRKKNKLIKHKLIMIMMFRHESCWTSTGLGRCDRRYRASSSSQPGSH